MSDAAAILRFLIDAAARGERTALVTLTDVVGGASRAPGTHMAVSETGAFLGSLSGGCVEAAVVAEAKDVIGRGRAESVRFGVGSRYIDIRLPCGGGIDLLFTPEPHLAVLEDALARLERREKAGLWLGRNGGVEPSDAAAGWSKDGFVVRHQPALRIVIVGHGEEPRALAAQATAFGADTLVLSPDSALVAAERALGRPAEHLRTTAPSAHLTADRRSAVVFLFHDHDWEGTLLAQALATEAFYIGAMGSRTTHARRLAELRTRGFSDEGLARVVGPVGLIRATRDPATLALSVLAQIVDEANVREKSVQRDVSLLRHA